MVTLSRKLFVEGGGENNDALRTECRKAFSKLLERAGCKGRMPRIVPCGRRQNAYDQFCTAIQAGEDQALLLVDSETPVKHADPWRHVGERSGDGWRQPNGATADHLHLMVQCMEAWFLADRPALAAFFGQGFNESALPPITCVQEEVGKQDLYDKLKLATRQTKTKGAYDKGEHAFRLLATLDPGRVRQASPWAERFFALIAGE